MKQQRVYLVAATVAIGCNVFSWQYPFFWDTLLTSSVAQHYLSHGFSGLILPPALDAGHPPLFYLYISLFLKTFGASLLTAHAAMLPFILTGVFSFIRLLRLLEFASREQWTGLFIFFAIPAVSAQYMLVSYDAVLLSLYLLSLVLFLEHKKVLFSIVLLLIAGITGRGIFAVSAIFLTCLLLHRAMIRGWWMTFLPGFMFFISWYGYHYLQTGYIFSADNGWSEHRGLANGSQIISNAVAVARSMFDLGIVMLFAANAFVFAQMRKLPFRFRIWLVPFIIFSFTFLFLSNPVNHRYYLVVYVLMALPVLKWLSGKRFVFSILFVLLLAAGHFQVYPPKISNGWDCTLAHLPYHKLKNDMLRYADSAGLDKKQIGSVFPMITSRKQDRFSGDTIRLFNVHGQPVDSMPFVLYSNVGNDFSDAQREQLQKWTVRRVQRSGFVELILYENPRFSN